MKKFLFTLAALLMAGAMSAAPYFYAPDIELTEEELGQPVLVNVMLHSDAIFNSYGATLVYSDNLTPDPDGDELIIDESECMILVYKNNKGKNTNLDTSGNLAGDVYEFMGFSGAKQGFWQDPNGTDPEEWVAYGAVKWEPMEEDALFLQIYVQPVVDGAKANFDGTITITSTFSAGGDTRPLPTVGQEYTSDPHVCHITFTAAEQPKTPFEATATIGDAEGYNVPLHYEANDPTATVTVTVNGTAVNVAFDDNGDAVLVLGEAPAYGEYNIEMTVAVGDTEHFEGDDVVATKKIEIAQPAAPQPMISFNTQDDGSVTVVVTDATSYTITVNGVEWTDGNNIPQTYEDQEIVVNATNHIEGYADNTNTASTTLQGKAKEEVDAPTITHAVGDAAVTVTVTPDPDTDGQLVYNGEYSYPRGDEDYQVTVTAYTTEGPTCQASATTTYTFTVPKKEPTPPTSIDELINGQNVAGVRYFNMAGQEMSQANGMTIVVVTYTDGTTSTVKVMK